MPPRSHGRQTVGFPSHFAIGPRSGERGYSGFDVVERGLHLFGSEALLGNGFDVTSGGSAPQEQPGHRRLLR